MIAKRALAHCRRPAIDFLCDSLRRIARIPFLPIALGATTALLFFIGRTDPYYRYLAIEYGIANTKLAVYWNPAAPAQIRRRDGTLIASTVGEVSASPSMQQVWGMTTKVACTALLFGTFVTLLLGLCKSIFRATAGERRQPASSPLRLETALPSDGNRQHELPFPARNPATGGTNPIPSTAQKAPITHIAGAPDPWSPPADGLSLTNLHLVAGTVCKDPTFTLLERGSRRLYVCVASQEFTNDSRTADVLIRTESHHVLLWDGLAERFRGDLKKGVEVVVAGSSRTRKWVDKQGAHRTTTELHARTLWLTTPPAAEIPDGDPATRKPSVPRGKPLFVRPNLDGNRLDN